MTLIANPLHKKVVAVPIPTVCDDGLDLVVFLTFSISEDSFRCRSNWAMVGLQLAHMEDRVERREAGR